MAAMLTAIIIVLQLIARFLRIGPFSITLVLVPIVIGAAILGWQAGLWLGLVFGATVLISGDANAFFAVSVPGTLITVLVKGIAAGTAASMVYKLFSKHEVLAVMLAAFTCPVVNTGIFLIGCRVFFWPTLAAWGAESGYANAAAYAIYGMVGINFLIEIAINMVCCPAIVRVIRVVAKEKF